MGTKPNLTQLIKSDGKLELTKVGINNASTFTGFCTYHDGKIFSPLENDPITLSDEQLFLLAYRSVTRELYLKEGSGEYADLMKEADRGMDIAKQLFIQSIANGYSQGVDLALSELNHIKSAMDQMLLSRDFSKINHFVVELSNVPAVLVSASTQPEFDFLGARLQALGQYDTPMSHIIFNCISYDSSGCFVFSWLNEHDAICAQFVDSLSSFPPQELGDALIRFCYSYAENTWASPTWWNSLNVRAREDISKRLHHGVPIPAPNDCLVRDGVQFNAYQVAGSNYRRSQRARQA